MKLAIGIDQSLTSGGFVALDVDTCEVYYSCVVRSDAVPGRYNTLFEKYSGLLFGLKDVTVHVMREHHAFAAKYGREAMGAAAAIVDMAVWDVHKNVASHASPDQVKKFCGAKKKDELRLKAFQKWGVEFKSNDEVDAYVLARIARGLYVGPADHLAYEREVLDKIKDNTWAPQKQQTTSRSKRTATSPSSASGPTATRKRSPQPSATPSTTAARSSSGRSVRVRSIKR